MSARRLLFTLSLCLLAASVASAQTVTVQPSDTLWSIAKRAGIDVATLKQINGLTSDQIRPGLVLKLPGSQEQVATASHTVTVQAGDTLYDIAAAHGVSVSDIIAFNDLDGTLSATLALTGPATVIITGIAEGMRSAAFSVIVVAAGTGSRFGGAKQYAPLLGRRVVDGVRELDGFLTYDDLTKIMVNVEGETKGETE